MMIGSDEEGKDGLNLALNLLIGIQHPIGLV